jgi:hypothetical protein
VRLSKFNNEVEAGKAHRTPTQHIEHLEEAQFLSTYYIKNHKVNSPHRRY